MKILVTGGAGFIGSNYIHYILNTYNEDSIVNLDKLTYAGNVENLSIWEDDPRYTFVKGDINDKELVDKLVGDVDVIVHFAAESHVDRSILGPEEFVRTNVIGTFVLLEAARKHRNKRFHHVSTDEVFGSLGETGLFSEKTAYDPRSPYSASKASSDHFVCAYFHTYGLPITISNCSNNYGPYQFPEKFIPLSVTNLIEKKKVPLYGEGDNVRDWIFVEDHVIGIDMVVRNGSLGETYCFGGDAEEKNKDVLGGILNEMKQGKEMVEYVEDRKGHDFRYAIDSSKAKKELGWMPKVTFEEGLKKTVAWYVENEGWWQPLKKRVIKDITK
ncbi:MAG: dTDP-glucose 4,6-dehydratase [Candidatus Pacebacteria bacterium]|nr:dTDP-glucose 4,6-dehydratase [Candidatus Paceibacterota bacterium]